MSNVRLQMKVVPILSIVAVAAGLLSGPEVLEAAEAAVPAHEWRDLPFIFAGSLVAVVIVVGLQIAMRKEKPARIASWLFGLGALYIAVSGLSALGFALYRATIEASAFIFLAMGIGTIAGAVATGKIHRAAFAT